MSSLLRDVADYSDSRISLDEINVETYVTTDNLLQNKQGKVSAVKMPKQASNTVTRFDKGDVLVANIRPYLKKIWLAKYTGGNSTDVLTFKAKEGFDATFVYYALFRDDFFEHMMNGSKGTKMPRGDKNQILDFTIPDFDIYNQKQIAKVLSDLDDKIELNNKINTELEAMAKLIYDYWFVQFDFPDENGKPYKSSGGKMVFNEALKREIPELWEVKVLGDYASIKKGKLITEKEANTDGKIKVVSAGKDFSYFHSESNYDANTITVSASGASAGFINFWREPIFANDCTTVRGNNLADTLQLLGFLQMRQDYIYQQARGSAQPHVYPKDIEGLKIAIPPAEVIEQYGTLVVSGNTKISNNLKENQKLAELRDWLLPMLMNGQVRVN